MKKLLLWALFLSLFTFANAVEIDGINYELSGNTASVTSNSPKYSGDIIIPESVVYNGNTYSVTSIGYSAFRDCSGLTSVKIPNSVTSIGDYAFNGCSGLTSVEIPNSVTSIGYSAFRDCSGLTSVKIPNSVTSIGNAAFNGCSGLTSIEIPNSVTSIGSYAFDGCSGLTSVEIPNSVTSIGDYAFRLCNGLTFVEIPNSVTSIGRSAFEYCHSMTSVEIGNSVTSIGNSAFNGCSLTSVKISDLESWCKIRFKDFVSNPLSYAHHLYLNNVEIKDLIIPNTVTSIHNYAFYGCSGLASIEIPNSVTSIGNSTFYGCSGLTSIEIPNSVTSIGSYAFYGCSGLSSVEIPSSVTSIDQDAFFDCPATFYIDSTTPASINSSFIGNAVLAVPLAAIEDYRTAWSQYKSQIVAKEYANADVTVVAKEDASAVLEAVLGDKSSNFALNIINLKVKGSINSYDIMAMRNKMTQLRTIDLSESDIVANSYEYLEGLCSNDSIIGTSMFSGLNITSIKLPKNTKIIDQLAFSSCNYLKEVVFPESLKHIGYRAFVSCNALTSLELPQNLETIEAYAFSDNYNLKSVNFGPNITTIGFGAFQSCNLESIVLPDRLETICGSAFSNNQSLKYVKFPKHLTSIEGYAFSQCAIEDLQLPTSLQYIGASAFASCSGLKEVRIPESIKNINYGAFDGCNNIKKIYTWTIAPTKIAQSTFSKEHFENATLYVPESSQRLYFYNTQWSQFLDIRTFNEPYTYFYLDGNDLHIYEETVRIEGENGMHPDADFSEGAGLIVEGDQSQDLGEVNIDNTSSLIGGDSNTTANQANLSIDKLVVQISIQHDHWYFFCFPFDVPRANIKYNGQFTWKYYDGEYRALNGAGAWKNQEGVLNANQGYIFSGSKDGILYITVDNVTISGDDKMIALENYPAANQADASWSLVGNPYTSFYPLSELGYTAPITIWNPNTRSYESYSPLDDDVVLHPYEAFFVQKPNDANEIGFDADSRETLNQTNDPLQQSRLRQRRMARAKSSEERYLLNLVLSSDTVNDKTRIVFNEAKSMEYEIGCDAAKFMSNEAPQIYTIDAKGTRYSINERPIAEGYVRLGLSTQHSGSFCLSASRIDVPMYLIDLDNGESIDLTTQKYEFDAKSGTNENRFVLSTSPSLSALRDIDAGNEAESKYYDLRGIRYENQPRGFSITDGKLKLSNQR